MNIKERVRLFTEAISAGQLLSKLTDMSDYTMKGTRYVYNWGDERGNAALGFKIKDVDNDVRFLEELNNIPAIKRDRNAEFVSVSRRYDPSPVAVLMIKSPKSVDDIEKFLTKDLEREVRKTSSIGFADFGKKKGDKVRDMPTKYRDAKVKVVSASQFYPQYFAGWWLDRNLKPVIAVDKPVAEAYERGDLAEDEMEAVLEHEYLEAEKAKKIAKLVDGKSEDYMKKYYTGRNAEKDRELDQYGGIAHEDLVNSFPGGSSAYYNAADRQFDIVYGR